MLKAKKIIKQYKLDYLLLALIMTFYYGKIQWNNLMGDPDGFYHAKIAQFITQGKIITDLPWMQFSSIKDNFTDHHLLYHMLLVPFVKFFDPLLGVKIATVIFAVAMILVFYWLLKKMSIPWPFVFALFFLTLSGLNFRLSLVKANSLSLLLIFLIIYSLIKQKYVLSFVLAWAFVWLYGGWPLAILILGAYLISEKIHHHLNTSRLKIFFHKKIHLLNTFHNKNHFLKTSLYLLGGLLAGLIINPYWPHSLYFYYQQFLQIGVINMGEQFNVGNEWYGASFHQIISTNPHLFFAALILIVILLFHLKKASALTWLTFFMTFGFLFLTYKSKRYIEYYMPFNLLFVASAVKDVYPLNFWKKILKKWRNLPNTLHIYLMADLFFLAVLVTAMAYSQMLDIYFSPNYRLDKFVQASQWLAHNTPKDSLVFHSDWDEWPILFYNNDHNYYIIGLDPTFMENYDSKLHKRFVDLTLGYISYQPSKYIKNEFQSQYIFVDKQGHTRFISNLGLDKNVAKVYEDSQTIIYKII